jgi:deazaflavin-dependent oxidoreductase (nitroreductase family)
MTEDNAEVIKGFRANEGRAGGRWEGRPLLLLHNTGAKSGLSRVNPVGYVPDGRRYVIWASNWGAPRNPAWYYNLKAYPEATIEVGGETMDVIAEEATGAERERLFAEVTERYPQLSDAERKSGRATPVLVLSPRAL